MLVYQRVNQLNTSSFQTKPIASASTSMVQHCLPGILSAAAHCRGFTALVHKVDALLYALALEVNTGDRQQSIRQYGHRVISCLSDQGAFSELFGTFW